jgi:DNA-binding SARP family transcriptional activator
MEFRILGPLEVVCDGTLIKVGGPRQQTVLAMLLLDAGKVIPIDRLIDAVWDNDPPVTAREQIQICVSTLRRHITAAHGSNLIETSSPGYLMRVGDCTLDARVFDVRVQDGRRVLATGDAAAAAVQLRGALALWRGDALSSIDSFLAQKSVTDLNERHMNVLEECIKIELDAGLSADLVGELASLVQEHPLHEHFRTLLMTSLYRAGRQADALESYREGRAVLQDELGIDPGRDLQGLHQLILSGEPPHDRAIPAAASAAPTSVRASRSAAATAPPPAVARTAQPVLAPQPSTAGVPSHAVARPQRSVPMLLPTTIPDFTGRSALVNEILARMAAAGAASQALPVTVLYGQGGAGKTSIAVHIAHQLSADFPDGQLFAQLQAGLHPADPHDILGRFLRTLGLSGASLPHDRDERAEIYRDLLAKRRVLVVLDNAVSEEQISPLLPGSARCAVLVTSRRRLTGLPASHFEVGTLSRRSASALLARIIGEDRVRAEPEAVDTLCALCGQLPLALRIVAARLAARPHWSVSTLVERLSDESHRLDEFNHDTMGIRASISLTYDALSPQARRLFGLLALSGAPDCASWVAAPLIETDIRLAEDLLEEMAEAYLLDAERDPALNLVRYRFRDITRLFALEKLLAQESPQERHAALERLTGALLYLAEQAHCREYSGGAALLPSAASRWELPDALTDKLLENPLAWYESERQSIVAGVRQAAAEGLVEHSWSLALAAVPLFETYSYFSDWRSTHETALDAACRSGDRRGEAAMRYSLGSLYMVERNGGEAARQLERARRLYSELGDRHATPLVLRNLAFLDRLAGDLDLAMETVADRAEHL